MAARLSPKVAARMRRHVLDLAAEGGVTVTWTRAGWRKAMAFIEPKPHVYVPEIRRPRDYYRRDGGTPGSGHVPLRDVDSARGRP